MKFDPKAWDINGGLGPYAWEQAKRILLRNEVNLPPTLIMVSDEVIVVPLPWYPAEREFGRIFMAQLLKDAGATSYAFVSTAWMTVMDKHHTPKEERQEALITVVAHREEQVCWTRFDRIVRNADGCPIAYEYMELQPTSISSALTDLFE